MEWNDLVLFVVDDDNDGIPDAEDPDDDNDGIPDLGIGKPQKKDGC